MLPDLSAADELVRPATSAEFASLASRLAHAFHDDPVFGWLMPRPDRRLAQLRRFFAIELHHVVHPTGTVWRSPGGEGALLELPPGGWRLPLSAQLAHGPGFIAAFGRGLPRAITLINRMEQRHLREPHHYIPYVGVAPDGQGRGLGTRLLEQTLARSDRTGLPAYLEASSPRNAALYERLGFRHLGELRVASSPPLWLMRRDPPAPAGA